MSKKTKEIKKEKREGFLDELKEDLFGKSQIKDLHPILDHYDIERNKKLGKKLFEP